MPGWSKPRRHRGSLFSAKRLPHPTQPGSSSNFADSSTTTLPPSSSSSSSSRLRQVSPPADGGGGAAPDAPERSQEGDLASPALPLRGRLPSPHLLPPLITKCKTSPTSSSTRPLVVDEAELRHTAAPARLDGVHVRGPPLHRHPQLLIPSQQQKSCSKLGIPTGHRHSHMSGNLTGSHAAEQTRRGHHCAGRRAAAN